MPHLRRTALPSLAVAVAFLFGCPIHAWASARAWVGNQMPAANPRLQDSTAPESAAATSPALQGIAHIAIRVKDVAASVGFYHKLGFDQPFTIKSADNVTVTVIKVNDRQFIEIFPPDSGAPGIVHFCFEGKDLNALHNAYASAGLSPAAIRTSGAGNLLFTMPVSAEGSAPLNLEFTQYLPGSLHSRDTGQHLGPDRVGDKIIAVALAAQDPAAIRSFHLDKLGFHPSAANTARLDLPGASGQAVELVPAAELGARASILLSTSDIDKAAAQLTRQQVAFQRAASNSTDAAGHTHTVDMIAVTDPDGNILRIAQAK
ncbi:MAG TPA: VOC family protein [Acidobacteriaceae bacterium]